MYEFPLHLHVIAYYYGVILCSTFKVQCTSLTMYTVVNGSTVIVCKLNNVRYCICVFGLYCFVITYICIPIP